MNIVFFGTNYDGSYFLQKLMRKHNIKIVVTDIIENDSLRKFLRRCLLRRRLTEDIARWSSKILLIDQARIAEKKFVKILKNLNINLGIVATFSKIIPRDIIEAIPSGIINVHPSLLPRYRGANPIFWAIRNGEKVFGVTIHYLNERIDEGNIILQKKIQIEDHHTIVDCKKIFAKEGVILLEEVIDMINNGKAESFPQDNEKASYYPRAKDEYRTLNTDMHDYTDMSNIIRASLDRGGAIFWNGEEKILVKSISRFPPKGRRYIRMNIENDVLYLLH